MHIKQLTIKNFKNFESETFTFGDQNVLKGKNGSGKSSIRDAILFVLYNQTSEGTRDTDRYVQKGHEFCEVELKTDFHTYLRQRSRTNSKFLVDNKESTQKEALTIPFETFSSVFNVGYFMKLTEKEQRQLLIQNTPTINRVSLFKKLGGKAEIIEQINSLNNLEETIKVIGARKLNLTKNKDKYSAILEYLKVCPLVDTKKSQTSITKKIQCRINSEIVRITRLLESNNYILKDLEQTYKFLTKLPIEEMKIKVSNLENQLKTEFKNVEIVLKELYKSEIGYREVFKFKINGLEYKNLSSGEKLRFDLVISKFFDSLLPESISCIFLDDSALLDEDIEVPVQSFQTQIWPHNIVVN